MDLYKLYIHCCCNVIVEVICHIITVYNYVETFVHCNDLLKDSVSSIKHCINQNNTATHSN